MKLIALKCPSCNGDLSLDSDKEFGFCTYCGTKIFLDTVQRVQYSGSVAMDRNQEIQNLLARAAEYENRGMIADAERYYDRVLDIDNTDEEARNGLDRTHGIVTDPNVTIERVPSSYDTRDRLAVKENGKSIARIPQGEAATIMLQVGEHELSFFIDGKLKKKLKVAIGSPYERHNIACENKSLGRLGVNSDSRTILNNESSCAQSLIIEPNLFIQRIASNNDPVVGLVVKEGRQVLCKIKKNDAASVAVPYGTHQLDFYFSGSLKASTTINIKSMQDKVRLSCKTKIFGGLDINYLI